MPQLGKLHENAERVVWTRLLQLLPSLKGSVGAGLMPWALP